MLTRVRIEVEEPTAEAAVLALTKYEHAMQAAEANRYGLHYEQAGPKARSTDVAPAPPPAHLWSDDPEARDFYNEQIGRELVEEVIEYDESIPAYHGRRVVRFSRLDTRSPEVFSMEHGWVAPKATDVVG